MSFCFVTPALVGSTRLLRPCHNPRLRAPLTVAPTTLPFRSPTLRPTPASTTIQAKKKSRPRKKRSSPGPKSSNPAAPTDSPESPLGTPPKSDTFRPLAEGETFIPEGPTLRKEYERRGLIEPQYSPDAGTLPPIVADRMLRRILSFGGSPLILLFSFFAFYFVLKYKYDITVLPVLVAYTTLGTISMAAAGITYGIFSSSWDEDIKGSWHGWEQASVNFLRATEALRSARESEKADEEVDRIDRLVAEEQAEEQSKS